jgi:dTDP-4-dehydrorhamnose 3,5-epimerase-like enzyme
MKKIIVKNSGIAMLNSFNDFPDGHLLVGETLRNIPIEVKRFYIIKDLFNEKAIRGKHAHKELTQYIFCLNGSFILSLDDGEKKQKIAINKSDYGIKLGPMLWHTMIRFSKDCVILVIADDYYDEKDYIRNYEDFIQQLQTAIQKEK